jgi:ketosteroid isomerase-like protein
VAEIHASATWIETGAAYEQDYVIWMALDEQGRIQSWREYWDKARV